MRRDLVTISITVAGLILLAGFSDGSADKVLRYRGDYTYGHEVRSFCPEINSQCYWVSAKSGNGAYAVLNELANVSNNAPYTPVCVVIEGRIDRDTERTGFAIDYDGLMLVSRVYGRCDNAKIVTQGDLQHHRWVLQSIDGRLIDSAALHGVVPEVDFGERMTVTGNFGCNRFIGQAILREEFFVITRLTLTSRVCLETQENIERMVRQVLSNESVITISGERQLVLQSDRTTLRFKLSDWRN